MRKKSWWPFYVVGGLLSGVPGFIGVAADALSSEQCPPEVDGPASEGEEEEDIALVLNPTQCHRSPSQIKIINAATAEVKAKSAKIEIKKDFETEKLIIQGVPPVEGPVNVLVEDSPKLKEVVLQTPAPINLQLKGNLSGLRRIHLRGAELEKVELENAIIPIEAVELLPATSPSDTDSYESLTHNLRENNERLQAENEKLREQIGFLTCRNKDLMRYNATLWVHIKEIQRSELPTEADPDLGK